VIHRADDRRRALRHSGIDQHGILSATVRPGHQVTVINISSGGALVETHRRLLPEKPVELVVERKRYRATVRGRVLRCAVVRVRASSIWYRGAIAFDRCLPWFVDCVDDTSDHIV